MFSSSVSTSTNSGFADLSPPEFKIIDVLSSWGGEIGSRNTHKGQSPFQRMTQSQHSSSATSLKTRISHVLMFIDQYKEWQWRGWKYGCLVKDFLTDLPLGRSHKDLDMKLTTPRMSNLFIYELSLWTSVCITETRSHLNHHEYMVLYTPAWEQKVCEKWDGQAPTAQDFGSHMFG